MQKILVSVCLFVAGTLAVSAANENVSLRYRFGKVETDLGKLEAVLSSVDVSSIDRIELRASSSPDGPYWANKQIAQGRADNAANKVKELLPGLGEQQLSVSVIAEDWSGVKRWLRRSNVSWKDEALKIVSEAAATEREDKLRDLWAGEAWDEMMRSAFPSLRSVKVTIIYKEGTAAPAESEAPKASLEVKEDSEATSSAALRILFPAGIRYVRPEFANNAEVLERIRSAVSSGKSVRLESFASPEGDPASNAALASRRAECVRAWLVEKMGVPESSIVVESKGEDWSGLTRIVSEKYDGSNCDIVVKTLTDESFSTAEKKAAIRSLDGGQTWRNLVKTLMPELRAVNVVVE